jgi:hypothetical protein
VNKLRAKADRTRRGHAKLAEALDGLRNNLATSWSKLSDAQQACGA